MPAGFQTYRENGSLQFDASLMTFSLSSKGSITSGPRFGANTSPSTFKVPVPAYNVMCAIRCGSVAALSGTGEIDGQKYYIYQCSGDQGTELKYWVFNKTSTFAKSNYGLELYNDVGEMTFSSNQETMILGGIASEAFTGNSSRSYAVVQTLVAGRSEEVGTSVYMDGQLYLESGVGGEPGSRHTWARQVDGKLYGFKWSNIYTAVVDEVSYDDVVGITNIGENPDPARQFWNDPMRDCMIVDVTGL